MYSATVHLATTTVLIKNKEFQISKNVARASDIIIYSICTTTSEYSSYSKGCFTLRSHN
jgi:hypothetical protein